DRPWAGSSEVHLFDVYHRRKAASKGYLCSKESLSMTLSKSLSLAQTPPGCINDVPSGRHIAKLDTAICLSLRARTFCHLMRSLFEPIFLPIYTVAAVNLASDIAPDSPQ